MNALMITLIVAGLTVSTTYYVILYQSSSSKSSIHAPFVVKK